MIRLSKPLKPVSVSINLGGSKSISNRLLIIDHLLKLDLHFQNISGSEDTILLQKALGQIKNNKSATIDVHHAGSDLRFLTALLSITGGEWILTGSERLKQRPVAELVKALNSLGASVQYAEKQDFPPLKITGKKLQGGKIDLDGSISSQFISALLLISPALNEGLEIVVKGKIVSEPYIQMTIRLLKEFGLEISKSGSVIRVLKSEIRIRKSEIQIESDWSSASYWYSICALSAGAQIKLRVLNEKSLQGDAVLVSLYSKLGVETSFGNKFVLLKNKKVETSEFSHDFTDCPDLAQTIAVTCFGLGINAKLNGLNTLKIKETDRIVALKNELVKFGAEVFTTANSMEIKSYPLSDKRLTDNESTYNVSTYNDHRMAMCFAPLALLYDNLVIENPGVVTKSYPRFWEDLKSAGFSVNLRA